MSDIFIKMGSTPFTSMGASGHSGCFLGMPCCMSSVCDNFVSFSLFWSEKFTKNEKGKIHSELFYYLLIGSMEYDKG